MVNPMIANMDTISINDAIVGNSGTVASDVGFEGDADVACEVGALTVFATCRVWTTDSKVATLLS